MNYQLEKEIETTKESYKEQELKYQESVKNNFGCTDEEIVQLNVFFENTYPAIISETLKKYRAAMTRNKSDLLDFHISTPIIATKSVNQNPKNYLLFLYLNKLEDLGFEDLGLIGVEMPREYIASTKIDQEIIFDKEKNDFYNEHCYHLSMSFSPKMTYVKKSQAERQAKLYRMVSKIYE